jgi:hypothetical protein
MIAQTLPAAAAAPSAARIAVNLVAFQVGWFACVLGGAHDLPWAGVATVVALVFLHIATAPRPAAKLRLIVMAAALGAVWDSALVWLGWISFASGSLIAGTAPVWIVALWALFATTLNVSLRALQDRPLLAAALGAIAGPLAYYAGIKLGAVELLHPYAALAALAVGWAAFTPLLLRLAKRCDGGAPAVV